jgi:hypothetical protein
MLRGVSDGETPREKEEEEQQQQQCEQPAWPRLFEGRSEESW